MLHPVITFPNGAKVEPTPNEGGTLYQAEASTIGLAPGEWPPTIFVAREAIGMEPEMPVEFIMWTTQRDADGDLTCVTYATRLRGTFLEVWND